MSSSFSFNDDDFDKFELYQRCLDQSVMNDMLAGDTPLASMQGISEYFNIFNARSNWDDFEFLDTNLVKEVVDSRDRSFITTVPSDNFYPWADESLAEDVLTGLSNFSIDVASSSNSGNNQFEFESLFGPSECEADDSFFEDFLAGLTNNVDVDSSLIEAIFGFGVKDGGSKKSNSDNWSDFGASLEGKTDEHKLHRWGWEDESLIDDILRAGGSDYATSALIDALFNYENNCYIESDSSSSKGDDLKSLEKEEEDFYMVHRKDAVKAIRSALHHSKAAKDASMKGDHASARQFKLKEKEDWAMAKKLNAMAAEKILSIKNSKNDMWTLDLHGLHAGEAVDAVRRRLQTIEALPQQSASLPKMNKLGKHKQICLRAITGRGNHSKGAAVLPSAVRKFLKQNGYQFNDSKPGSFMIQPKIQAG